MCIRDRIKTVSHVAEVRMAEEEKLKRDVYKRQVRMRKQIQPGMEKMKVAKVLKMAQIPEVKSRERYWNWLHWLKAIRIIRSHGLSGMHGERKWIRAE